MRTPICDLLGCEVPILAFSHSGAVVAAVSRAGGFGVLGGSTYSPERFAQELDWIDEHIGGRPYGVDVIIPSTYSAEAEASQDELLGLIPDEHRAFVDGLLAEHDVPELEPAERDRLRAELAAGRGGMTPQGAISLVRTASHHEQVRLVVSALGILPRDVVAEVKSRDVLVGAMCGKARHAEKQVAAGAQIVVAQGTEAGGHSGEISTMVLVPEIVERVGDKALVLAAGGISHGSQIVASLAMGAQGVWCGTIWLGTSESELDDFERRVVIETPSDATARRKARTGKTVRMIRSRLSEAWEEPGAPAHLDTPLQGVLFNEAHARVVRAECKELFSFPAGQSVGAVREESTVAEVVARLRTEYEQAMDHLAGLRAGVP